MLKQIDEKINRPPRHYYEEGYIDGKDAYEDCKQMLEEVIAKIKAERGSCVTTHKGTFENYLAYQDGLNYAIKLLKGEANG